MFMVCSGTTRPNNRRRVDAGWRILFAVQRPRPRATHAEGWASRVSVKYAIKSVLVVLLLGACVHHDSRDAKLREQIIGSWSHAGSVDSTFSGDGGWRSEEKTSKGTVRTEGKWDVQEGALITKVAHVCYLPTGTNFFPTINGGPDTFQNKIVLVDNKYLAIAIDATPYHGAKTNLWERKQ
jgi:hypothetical protein